MRHGHWLIEGRPRVLLLEHQKLAGNLLELRHILLTGHGIETPDRYLLMIWWHTLENHTVDFRQGPLFAEWRSHIGPFLASPPNVEHFDLALESA